MEYFDNFANYKKTGGLKIVHKLDIEYLRKITNNYVVVENIEQIRKSHISDHCFNIIDYANTEQLKNDINSFFIQITEKYDSKINMQIVLLEEKIIFIDSVHHETFVVYLNDLKGFEINHNYIDDHKCNYYEFNFLFDFKDDEDTLEFKFLIYNIFEINSEFYQFILDEEKTKNIFFEAINKHYFKFLTEQKIRRTSI